MAGTITTSGTSLEQQCYETCLALQAAEQASTADPQPDNVTVTYDLEGQTVTIGITLPITYNSTGGNTTITADTYLA